MAETNGKEKTRNNHLIRQDRVMPPEGSVKSPEAFAPESKDQFLAAIKAWGEIGAIYLTTQGDMAPVDHEIYFNRGRAFKAMSKAHDRGIPAQIFTIHDFWDKPEAFSVEQENTNWRVYPVEMTEGEAPGFIQEPVSLFKSIGVEFDHYAVAVSGKPRVFSSIHTGKEDTDRILKPVRNSSHQSGNHAHPLSTKAARIAWAMGRSIGSTLVGALTRLTSNKPSSATTLLLGCYGLRSCFLVEIARWEPRHRKHRVSTTRPMRVSHGQRH